MLQPTLSMVLLASRDDPSSTKILLSGRSTNASNFVSYVGITRATGRGAGGCTTAAAEEGDASCSEFCSWQSDGGQSSGFTDDVPCMESIEARKNMMLSHARVQLYLSSGQLIRPKQKPQTQSHGLLHTAAAAKIAKH